MKKTKTILLFVLCMLLLLPTTTGGASAESKVMILPLDKTVEKGLSAYLERNILEAEQLDVDYIILEMDTPGGRVDAAQDIKRVIYNSHIPIIALVKDQALSAGAYIALACDQIAMMPGSTIGDAEMLINGQRADEKYLSPWREEFGALAEKNGRDPIIAKAFVDRDIEIDGLIESGKLLTLSAQTAVALGIADYQVESLQELLEHLEVADGQIIYGKVTITENITRIVTSPYVAPFLLSLGVICLVLEFIMPGFGLFFGAGISLLSLYFGGHMIAEMGSWMAVLLFLIGIILCVVEIFVPGFGIFGILGLCSIIGSIFLTTPDIATAIQYSVVVLVTAMALLPIILKIMQKRKFFDKLTVKETLTTDKGYTARNDQLHEYLGAKGIAKTVLRPAGTMILENGTHLDVVTRGEFINQGDKIVVKAIDGTWLIVQKIES